MYRKLYQRMQECAFRCCLLQGQRMRLLKRGGILLLLSTCAITKGCMSQNLRTNGMTRRHDRSRPRSSNWYKIAPRHRGRSTDVIAGTCKATVMCIPYTAWQLALHNYYKRRSCNVT